MLTDINNIEMAFYSVGETNLIDIAVRRNGEWTGAYSGENLEEMRKRYPVADLLPFDEACKRIDAAQTAKYCRPPAFITAEQFDDMLNVLPPCKWYRGGSEEAFHVSEHLCGDLVSWCVRIGNRHFELTRSCRNTAREIITEVASYYHDELGMSA